MATEDNSVPKFEIREAPGMDLGMFALVDIPKGSVIIREKPLCTVPGDSYYVRSIAFENCLPAESEIREKLFSLKISGSISPDVDERSKFDCIYKTNGLQTPERGVAIFEAISRINHSCDPNSYWCWNESLGQGFVIATEVIPVGTQILISYLHQDVYQMQKGERREHLRKCYHFQCECSLCMTTVNPKRKNHPNKVRRRFRALCEERTKQYVKLALGFDYGRMKQLTEQSIVMINTFFNGAPIQLGNAYYDMYMICLKNEDWPGALEWITKCMDTAILSQTNEGTLAKVSLENYLGLIDSGKVRVSKEEKKLFMKRYKGGNFKKSELKPSFLSG
eukprot:198608_1